SFLWTGQLGLLPSIALLTTNNPTLPPDTTHSHVGINNQIKNKDIITLFPNPASDYMNVAVSLDQMANSVTYKIIDALGRAVNKETHNNVLSETYTVNTSALRSG